jgi:hypothetical protein
VLTPGEREVKQYGRWYLPRLSEAESVEYSLAMVVPFQNQIMKLLRSLPDLRRHAPSLVIQNAGQVNVGQQQVNVGEAQF